MGGLGWGGASVCISEAPWGDSSFTSIGTKHVTAAVHLAPRPTNSKKPEKRLKRNI